MGHTGGCAPLAFTEAQPVLPFDALFSCCPLVPNPLPSLLPAQADQPLGPCLLDKEPSTGAGLSGGWTGGGSRGPQHSGHSQDQGTESGLGTSGSRAPALLLRFVLAVGSAVFDAMFNGGMATTSTEIELPDVEPAAFLALLK